MRFIRLLLLALVAIALVIMGFANREIVTLTLLPPDLAEVVGSNHSFSLPLYAAVLAGIGLGLLLGFFWEWVREGKHRDAATRERRQRAQLEAENRKLKAEKNAGKDEVLVLLEDGASAR